MYTNRQNTGTKHVRVANELHKKLKILVAQNSTSITAILNKLIEQYLEDNKYDYDNKKS